MNEWTFAVGLAALAQVSITFLVQIARILFARGKRDTMLSRVVAVFLGLAVGAAILPQFLPIGATTDVLYARLINARDDVFQQGLNFAGLSLVAFIGTFAMHELGLAREGERARDVLLFVICLMSALLLRILAQTLFRHQPGEQGFLALQMVPALACSIGSLLAVAYIHAGGSVMDTDVDQAG
jgi:hypothetical protein